MCFAATKQSINEAAPIAESTPIVPSVSIRKVQFSNANLVMENNDTVKNGTTDVATEFGGEDNGDRPSFSVSI